MHKTEKFEKSSLSEESLLQALNSCLMAAHQLTTEDMKTPTSLVATVLLFVCVRLHVPEEAVNAEVSETACDGSFPALSEN